MNTMTAVTTTIDGAIAVIRVDNPPVNALSDVVLDGLVAALGSIPPSPEVRAVVLTGTDLYRDLTSGEIPCVRHHAELEVA